MPRYELGFVGYRSSREPFPRFRRFHSTPESAHATVRRVVKTFIEWKMTGKHQYPSLISPILYGPNIHKDGISLGERSI